MLEAARHPSALSALSAQMCRPYILLWIFLIESFSPPRPCGCRGARHCSGPDTSMWRNRFMALCVDAGKPRRSPMGLGRPMPHNSPRPVRSAPWLSRPTPIIVKSKQGPSRFLEFSPRVNDAYRMRVDRVLAGACVPVIEVAQAAFLPAPLPAPPLQLPISSSTAMMITITPAPLPAPPSKVNAQA